MNNKKKKKIKLDYTSPTSNFWRKIGDSLLASCLLVIPFMTSDAKAMRILAFVLIVGKFITSFINDQTE